MKVEKLVLDAGPLLTQSREELLARADALYTTPAVLSEIKDESARRRLALLEADLQVQQPSKDAISFVAEFSKKTGDFTVLSGPDIDIIALTYDLHDKTGLHSAPLVVEPGMAVVEHSGEKKAQPKDDKPETEDDPDGWSHVPVRRRGKVPASPSVPTPSQSETKQPQHTNNQHVESTQNRGNYPVESVSRSMEQKLSLREETPAERTITDSLPVSTLAETGDDDSDHSDNEAGWITPDNLVKTLRNENGEAVPIDTRVSAALASRDFAVQNVALQIGLDIVNDAGLKITQLRNYMQRCHACFKLLPLAKTGLPRQFCPRCGGHTLTRVTVSVEDGTLHVHLKANMQWKTRGDRYSLPKPQSRRARRERHDGRIELYAEDQPEYMKAVTAQDRQRRKNAKLLDDWTGPGTVDTGASPFVAKRSNETHVRIGRGRNANAAK